LFLLFQDCFGYANLPYKLYNQLINMYLKYIHWGLGIVVHACNPAYVGGTSRMIETQAGLEKT
jgi:hypothetical protein